MLSDLSLKSQVTLQKLFWQKAVKIHFFEFWIETLEGFLTILIATVLTDNFK